jgi:Ca-activated chloride channel family protein
MTFQWPLALLALAAIPVLAAVYVRRERDRAARAAPFATPALLPNLVPRPPGRRRHVPLAVLLAGLTILLVGVARPHATVKVPREDATVILAVDTSRSMGSKDVPPTRLAAARSAARAFLAKVPGKYQVGVVAFASRATTALPPTTDRDLARTALDGLRLGEGTVVGDAVALSTRLARKRPAAVVLISDGANEGGRVAPATAARRARARRIPVYTVLVGTPNGRVERVLPGGFREVVQVPSSPQTLQLVARVSGGRFFTAAGDRRLREVYEKLGSRLGHRTTSREVTDVFAGGSAALLLVGAALSTLWFRRPV